MKPPAVVLGLMSDMLKNQEINLHSGCSAELLPSLRCPKGQQPLGFEQPEWEEGSVVSGRLNGARCGRNYLISDGIAILLETQDLDEVGQREQRIRDEENRGEFQREAEWHE